MACLGRGAEGAPSRVHDAVQGNMHLALHPRGCNQQHDEGDGGEHAPDDREDDAHCQGAGEPGGPGQDEDEPYDEGSPMPWQIYAALAELGRRGRVMRPPPSTRSLGP
jgi:hypothetical protein